MKRLFISALIIVTLTGCSNSDSGMDNADFKTNMGIKDYFTITYFPTGIFDTEFRNEWYSGNYISLKEPSLYQLRVEEKYQSYRLMIIDSFRINDNPIVIRIDINPKNNSGILYYKTGRSISNSVNGGNEIYINKDKEIELSKTQIEAFLKKVEDTNFWDTESINNEYGLDGSQWIIEGLHEDKYHLVDRWELRSGPMNELALMFQSYII